MSLEWMVWTMPTAIFFACIAAMLVAMTLWQLVSPGRERRGFLPITTTRGDRLFIGLLVSAYIHLLWIGLTNLAGVTNLIGHFGLIDLPLWYATILSAVWMIVAMRWA